MNRAEYWLMDSVVEACYPLFWLVLNTDDLEAAYNRVAHRMNKTELVDVLYNLVCRGDIVLHQMDQGETHLIPHPSCEEIMAGLQRERDIDYGLSAQGGACWESFTSPLWERFIDVGDYLDPIAKGEIIATDGALVEEYLSIHRFTTAIVPGTESWDVLSLWQATYWKTLPCGHRLQYIYDPHGVVPETPVWASAKLDHFNNWYTPLYE
ncbi:MAG: hypothetical protein AAGF95_13215 [Chloroflexota bacterium]